MINILSNLKPEGKVAVLVSGGIDSTVMLHALRKTGHPLTTVNMIRSKEEVEDYLPWADKHILMPADDRPGYERTIEAMMPLFDEFDQVWSGENKLPPIPGGPPRSEGIIYNEQFKNPLMAHTKDVIIRYALDEGIDLSKTFSCSYYPGMHCRECWQCKEREWGFNQNNMEAIW